MLVSNQADLAVDFPAGTTNPVDSTQELKTFRELLGDIPAGGSAKKDSQRNHVRWRKSPKSYHVSVTI